LVSLRNFIALHLSKAPEQNTHASTWPLKDDQRHRSQSAFDESSHPLTSRSDRTNIGNARLAGLETDLKMTGAHDYNNALTIFFISYGLAEPATNVMLKRLTPRVFFTGIILLWGLIMTLSKYCCNCRNDDTSTDHLPQWALSRTTQLFLHVDSFWVWQKPVSSQV
jgi:hypothetical protein